MLNVSEIGNPSGEPVLFLHGYMSSNRQWDLSIDRLGQDLRMILVELPGHGQSAAPDTPDAYGPDVVLPKLDQIREDLGLERCWIVGHSLGGAVAARYALAYPDRVHGVVVTNSRAMFGIPRPTTAPRPPATIEERRAMRAHPFSAKRFPAEIKQRMIEAADAMPAHAIGHMSANVSEWGSADELGDFAVPVLLVNGRWEKRFQPFVPVASAEIPNLKLVELEGGHSINVEQPEAFDLAVLSFIRDTMPEPLLRP